MRIRATLHLGDQAIPINLYPVMQETDEHLILKLAACVFFHRENPIVISSPEQHPALAGGEYAPDFVQVDLTNQVTLWLECGKTTLNKLDKASKRHRQARIIMLFAQPHEGRQMKETLMKEELDRVEVWTFAEGEFNRWKSLVQEQNDIIGESDERSMNLVINDQVFMTELVQPVIR